MATATLELVNPYSKIGLKSRPTYNEIINLIDENETITGNLQYQTEQQHFTKQVQKEVSLMALTLWNC